MKGVSIGIEFMGRILIAIFIVGVIIILLVTFLPDVFFGSFCRNGQAERINNMFADASSTRSHTIKAFVVESCVEYIDFTGVQCKPGLSIGSVGEKRCYEVLYVGESKSNCVEYGAECKDPVGVDQCVKECPIREKECEAKCIKEICGSDDYCSEHRGLFAPLPGGLSTFEIERHCDIDGVCSGLKYKPGKYSVEIGPYSIKFLNPSS